MASCREMEMQLFFRCLHPAEWYFDPVSVTYTVVSPDAAYAVNGTVKLKDTVRIMNRVASLRQIFFILRYPLINSLQ